RAGRHRPRLALDDPQFAVAGNQRRERRLPNRALIDRRAERPIPAVDPHRPCIAFGQMRLPPGQHAPDGAIEGIGGRYQSPSPSGEELGWWTPMRGTTPLRLTSKARKSRCPSSEGEGIGHPPRVTPPPAIARPARAPPPSPRRPTASARFP